MDQDRAWLDRRPSISPIPSQKTKNPIQRIQVKGPKKIYSQNNVESQNPLVRSVQMDVKLVQWVRRGCGGIKRAPEVGFTGTDAHKINHFLSAPFWIFILGAHDKSNPFILTPLIGTPKFIVFQTLITIGLYHKNIAYVNLFNVHDLKERDNIISSA